MKSEDRSTMSKEEFLSFYPEKKPDDSKISHGRVLMIAGGYGMAGAACMNLIGTITAGSAYTLCALPDTIYPIVATRFLTAVYYPFNEDNWRSSILPLLPSCSAVGFGSGAVRMPHKSDILDLLLQECHAPIILDAEALHLLKQNLYVLRYAKSAVILTPHIGEFSELTGLSIKEIHQDPLAAARIFAAENHVIVILKGPRTIVADPSGKYYINETGGPALAQAGSGDVLTGIVGALAAVADPFTAARMAVWLHGHLADQGLQFYSAHTFPLEAFPKLMNQFMKECWR